MSKTFTGTILLDAVSYDVEGTLTKKGNRITGTLVFQDDTNRLVPIQLIQSGTQVSSATAFFFIGPNGEIIKVFPIVAGDTTIDADFTEIEIEADIENDGVAQTIEISIAVEPEELEAEGFTLAEAIPDNTVYRRTINRVRINEVGNLVDHFGGLLSTPRIEGESNKDYKNRLKAVIARRSSSSYTGLTNGVSAGLSLPITDAIRVTIRDDHADDKAGLRLVVEEGYIRIYTGWVNEEDQALGFRPELEQEAELGVAPVLTIGHVADWINESANYQADLLAEEDLSATLLLKTDSRVLIQEVLIPQEIMMLSEENVIPGSITFSSTTTLKNEVSDNSSLEEGEYMVEYEECLIKAQTPPEQPIGVSYLASRVDFNLEACEVKILDLSTEGTQEILFEQIERDLYSSLDGQTVNGLPTNEMYGILRQVLTAGQFSQFWGE